MSDRPEDQPAPPHRVHLARGVAESFGVDAARYDRARPRYPDALVHRVLDACPGRAVLAVGSGTGVDARQFQAAGATVLGVEPDARMAAFARAHGVETEEARFEAWDPADRTFDAVVAGTCWHWVDPAVGASKAARVLRPGGVLALYGHVYEPPRPVADAYDEAFRAVAPDSPLVRRTARSAVAAYEALYGTFADHVRATGAFGEPAPWRHEEEQASTRERWLDLLATTGGLTSLASSQVDEVLGRVGRAIDALDDAFTVALTTVMITARKHHEDQK